MRIVLSISSGRPDFLLGQPIPSPKSVNFEVVCTDGVRLVATLFGGTGGEIRQDVAIINPGAGIPASYYHPFALWLSERGIPTTTYDYRGIGKSRSGSLKGFRASVEDWGSKDCAAVLQATKQSFPNAKITVIGHSIGGFVTGFLTEPECVDKFVIIGGHTGFYGDYAPNVRIKMLAAWHIMMPAVTWVVGIFPVAASAYRRTFHEESRWSGQDVCDQISGGTSALALACLVQSEAWS